jgi:formylmethanofuran dehydrogenase subunit E
MIERCLAAILLFGLVPCCLGEEPVSMLPKPDYQRDAADPDWLAYAAQFHGHLGPWAAAGLRAGACARQALKAQGYFDVDVTVEGPFVKPPHSCFLDGLQVSTGATLGKRNLTWVEADEIVVRVRNTKTGRTVEVRPTPALMKLLASLETHAKAATAADSQEPEDYQAEDAAVEALARKVAIAPEEQILSVTFARGGGDWPDPAPRAPEDEFLR